MLGGELQPFQWAGVRYALDARRAFLADEQGLGKTVEALAALEADDAYPAIVVCPASLKLNWEREAARWLPHRAVAVVDGPRRGAADAATSRSSTTRSSPPTASALARARAARARRRRVALRARTRSAKRTQAVRRLADGARRRRAAAGADRHAGAQPRRGADRAAARASAGSRTSARGARFARQFRGAALTEERLHWHLRRRCFVRRLKAEVLPQLPAKRQVVVPVALDNEREYRLAEDDVIAWLRDAAARPLRARTRRSPRRCAPSASRSSARCSASPRAASCTPRWPGSTTSSPPASRSSCSPATSRCRRRCSSASPTRCTCSARDARAAARGGGRARSRSRDGPQLIVCATRVAGAGHHAHARVERRVPRARVDAGDARPGRGPLPPHRPARRRDRLVPARRRHDRRDDGRADRSASARIVAAVTDGRRLDGDGARRRRSSRELRDGRPFRHLRPVA